MSNYCGLCENTGYLVVAGWKESSRSYKIGYGGGVMTRKLSTLCKCQWGIERSGQQGDSAFNDYRAQLAIDFIRENTAEAKKYHHEDGKPWSYAFYLDAMVFFHRFGEYPKWAGGSGKAERRNAAMVHSIGGLGDFREKYEKPAPQDREPTRVDEIETPFS